MSLLKTIFNKSTALFFDKYKTRRQNSKGSNLSNRPAASYYQMEEYWVKNEDPNQKVLVIGVESDNFVLDEGITFRAGNHPIELLVPMLHLEQGGFEIALATPTGKPLKIEDRFMPIHDPLIMDIYYRYNEQINKPLALSNIANSLDEFSPYVAVLLPGGTGALFDYPYNKSINQVLQWARMYNKSVITIAQGSTAFISDANDTSTALPYAGYTIAFSDAIDCKIIDESIISTSLYKNKISDLLCQSGLHLDRMEHHYTVTKDRNLISACNHSIINQLGKITVLNLLNKIYQ